MEELIDCCHYDPCHSEAMVDPFTCVHQIDGVCSDRSYKHDTKCVCHNNTCIPIGRVNGSCSNKWIEIHQHNNSHNGLECYAVSCNR